jgi:hypothetical protein
MRQSLLLLVESSSPTTMRRTVTIRKYTHTIGEECL